MHTWAALHLHPLSVACHWLPSLSCKPRSTLWRLAVEANNALLLSTISLFQFLGLCFWEHANISYLVKIIYQRKYSNLHQLTLQKSSIKWIKVNTDHYDRSGMYQGWWGQSELQDHVQSVNQTYSFFPVTSGCTEHTFSQTQSFFIQNK